MAEERAKRQTGGKEVVFTTNSIDYRCYRPIYPASLFDFLVTEVPSTQLAWDCATGNGQAAVMLGDRFSKVFATDTNSDQLRHAILHPNVLYSLSEAESAPAIPTASIDIVTVAQAIHWFNADMFYRETTRVLKPEGILAFWATGVPRCGAIDQFSLQQLQHRLSSYWPQDKNIAQNFERYRSYKMPFSEVKAPHFELTVDWSLDQFLGYLRSWSASQVFLQATNKDPLLEFSQDASKTWGDSQSTRPVIFDIFLRVGRR